MRFHGMLPPRTLCARLAACVLTALALHAQASATSAASAAAPAPAPAASAAPSAVAASGANESVAAGIGDSQLSREMFLALSRQMATLGRDIKAIEQNALQPRPPSLDRDVLIWAAPLAAAALLATACAGCLAGLWFAARREAARQRRVEQAGRAPLHALIHRARDDMTILAQRLRMAGHSESALFEALVAALPVVHSEAGKAVINLDRSIPPSERARLDNGSIPLEAPSRRPSAAAGLGAPAARPLAAPASAPAASIGPAASRPAVTARDVAPSAAYRAPAVRGGAVH